MVKKESKLFDEKVRKPSRLDFKRLSTISIKNEEIKKGDVKNNPIPSIRRTKPKMTIKNKPIKAKDAGFSDRENIPQSENLSTLN